MGSKSEPLISIVTSTFNAGESLAVTADSIRAQSYPAIQWIVIDGASRDGTAEVIRRNSDVIDYWVSEPDEGIYDAWNKGCARVKGDWVIFLGAGDELADPGVLAECANHLAGADGKYELVYGRIQLVSPDGRVIGEIGEPWSNLKGKWGGLLPLMPPHPATFHHRSMFSSADAFDTRFRYAGDSAFVARSVLKRDPLYIPVVVDRMLGGGVSVQPENVLRIAGERRAIAGALRLKPPMLHSARWAAGIALQTAARTLLPASLLRSVRRLFRGRAPAHSGSP